MPVNTAALKTFAPAMRRQLLEAVGRKLDLLLNSQTPDTLSTYAKQISELRNQEAENREQLLERVAYTWFNRLCALRYLDARGWHPFGCKVLMPAAEGETQPELLKLMRAGSLPAELKPLTNEARLHGLLDGQIPPAISGADPQGEVYRELVLASSRSYHQLLPELFEGLDDASELLLPDDLLSEGSIAGGFRNAISDADCEDVEIIGWLYQFYISEKKDQVIGKVVKSEDIPAATQLFTPNWIVKYMVQNSLGATWLATYPDSPLKGEMEFYIEPAEQTEEVNAQLADITPESLDPEELTLIDPACGSGHILVEAYDLLKAIYLERGYRQRDIPELILTKNLYGLDICPRAAQLATFSLLMRGREDDRRLLERGIQLNVMALQDSAGLNVERLAASVDLAAAGVSRADVRMLAELFAQATILGSLIRVPAVLAEKLAALSHLGERVSEDLLAAREISRLRLLARQAAMLARRYDAIAANPPYMGGKFQNPALKSYLKTYYAGYERDIYTAFVIRCMEGTRAGSRIGIVCPNTWMYISTHEKFRAAMVSNAVLDSLAEMPLTAIRGATVQVCAFAFRPASISNTEGIYFRLSKTSLDYSELPAVFKALIKNPDKGYVFKAAQRMFKLIPRSPFAYWISKDMLDVFQKGSPMSLVAEAKQGLATADNNRFVRLWHEVSIRNINFCASSRETAKASGRKWFPYNKGGDFRKWFGNQEHVVNWRDDGKELYEFRPKAVIRNPDYYFLPSITWTLLSSSYFGVRRLGEGFIFDVNGMSLFGKKERLDQILPFMTSVVSKALLDIINPTFAFQVGDIEQLPVIHLKHGLDNVASNSEALQFIHREDWNSCERAWDFGSMPLLTLGLSSIIDLRPAFCKWIERSQNTIVKAKLLEEENNQIFIDAYGLHNEITPKVPIEQITLSVNPAYRYGGNLTEEEMWTRFRRDTMAEFISYATGCMMGRYSLDHPGLILADPRASQAEQLAAYEAIVGKSSEAFTFQPDPDGIIPVLDGEWFEDDIVARTREFLAVTFPESSVTENLRFIEESLGKDIRKYFCSEFYKDHLQTYKKRPIYWMVQSPKKGFSCLIYLHRYTKDTLNQVLNNYFRPYLQKLEARLAQLGLDQLNDDLSARERTAARKEAEKITKVLKECQAWEQDALLPLAQQRIELNLDDGVKVNYLKLQDVLAPIPGLAAKED